MSKTRLAGMMMMVAMGTGCAAEVEFEGGAAPAVAGETTLPPFVQANPYTPPGRVPPGPAPKLDGGRYSGPARMLVTVARGHDAQGAFGVMENLPPRIFDFKGNVHWMSAWLDRRSDVERTVGAQCSGNSLFVLGADAPNQLEVLEPESAERRALIEVAPNTRVTAALDLGALIAVATEDGNRIVIADEAGTKVASVSLAAHADEDGVAEVVAMVTYNDHLYAVLRGHNRLTQKPTGARLVEIEPASWSVTRALDLNTLEPTRPISWSTGKTVRSPAVMVSGSTLLLEGRRARISDGQGGFMEVGERAIEKIDLAAFTTDGWLFRAEAESGQTISAMTMNPSDESIYLYVDNAVTHGGRMMRYSSDGFVNTVDLQGGDSGDWPVGSVLAVDVLGATWTNGMYLDESFLSGLLYIPSDTKKVQFSFPQMTQPVALFPSNDVDAPWLSEISDIVSCH